MFAQLVAWLSQHLGSHTIDVLVVWFGVHWCYVLTMQAQDMRRRGTLNPYWLVHLGPTAIVGLLLDVVFNLTVGTLLYAFDLPRELLFTLRTRRNALRTGGDRLNRWRGRMGQWWKRQLNAVREGHV